MARRTRPRRLRRSHLAAATLLVASPGLAACGFGVQTDQPYQPSVGSNQREGSINVLGATIVVAGETTADQGTFSAGLVNESVDTGVELTSIETDSTDHEVTLLAPVEVGPEAITNLSDSGAVLVEGDLTPGGYLGLTLTFDNGDEVSIDVPVVNDLEEFADVVPAEPEASPSEPTTSPSAQPETEPETPTETPTAGPSSSPSEG